MDFTRYEAFLEKAKADPKVAGCQISSILFQNKPAVMLHRDLEPLAKDYKELGKEPRLVIASCFEVVETAKNTTMHVFAYYDGEQLHINTEDGLLSGARADDAPALIDAALAKATIPEALKETLRRELNDQVGTLPAQPPGWFPSSYYAATPSLYSHANTVLKEHGRTLWQDMEKAWESFALTNENVHASDEFTLEMLAFKAPVLIEGERGVGKTYETREFARANGYKLVECAGHESIESIDLLGHYAPTADGRHVWKDGKLAQAFRSAAAGEDVVFLFDELLRVPQRQLSILLTSLSPDMDGNFNLSTGRIVNEKDGVGVDEVIKAPSNKLCVVATTNAGQGYAVDEIDPALAERFVPLRKESSLDKIRDVLTKEAGKKGLTAAVEPAIQFYVKMRQLYDQGQLEREPSMRTLVRAFSFAKEGSLADVKLGLKGQALLWAARDSNAVPLVEQVEAIRKTVDNCFAAGKTKTKGVER